MLVVFEESYKISVWCREILEGLHKEARKKRVSLTQSTDIEDIARDQDSAAVIIVGAETEWLNRATRKSKESGKHPIILSNQSESDPENGVSRVAEDIYGSMSEIMALYTAKGYESTALYACNPDSASDSFKKEAFLKSGGKLENVFQNEGSLDLCFNRFYEKHKEKRYGGIVCANDFAAISLIRHLKDKDENIGNIDVISYSNTIIARCTSPAVSTVKANFKSFGQLAFMIVDCIGKSENISGIRVFCNWEIIHRDTSSPSSILNTPEVHFHNNSSGSFYGDGELMEMMFIETLLSRCDETDFDILEAILQGKKTATIEESCFLAETAVKYRIKKMKEICHVESRSALRELLLKYISHSIDKPISTSYN